MLLAAAVGEGDALGVALGVGVGVGVGVAVGVGVGVGVAVGVGATGVGVGVGVTGVGVVAFALGKVTMNLVVPGKKVVASIVKTSFATSPRYSLKTAPFPSSNTRIVTLASALKILMRPSASEHPEPKN